MVQDHNARFCKTYMWELLRSRYRLVIEQVQNSDGTNQIWTSASGRSTSNSGDSRNHTEQNQILYLRREERDRGDGLHLIQQRQKKISYSSRPPPSLSFFFLFLGSSACGLPSSPAGQTVTSAPSRAQAASLSGAPPPSLPELRPPRSSSQRCRARLPPSPLDPEQRDDTAPRFCAEELRRLPPPPGRQRWPRFVRQLRPAADRAGLLPPLLARGPGSGRSEVGRPPVQSRSGSV
jgi:hypothetical protein